MPVKIEEKHGFRYHIIECDFCLEMIERDEDGVVAFTYDHESEGASITTCCNRKKCGTWRKFVVSDSTTLMPFSAFIVYLADSGDLSERNREALTRKFDTSKR